MFWAMSSPIIRSTWLYLQRLILSIGIATGWCHGWVVNDDQQDATILAYLFIPNQLYVFWTMSSPIIRSTWLHLQHLILSTSIAAGWCHGRDGTLFHLLHDTSQQQYRISWRLMTTRQMIAQNSFTEFHENSWQLNKLLHRTLLPNFMKTQQTVWSLILGQWRTTSGRGVCVCTRRIFSLRKERPKN